MASMSTESLEESSSEEEGWELESSALGMVKREPVMAGAGGRIVIGIVRYDLR